MCLVTTKPTRTYRDSVVDPPRHTSYYSAHTAGRVSLPRSQRNSYIRSTEYVCSLPSLTPLSTPPSPSLFQISQSLFQIPPPPCGPRPPCIYIPTHCLRHSSTHGVRYRTMLRRKQIRRLRATPQQPGHRVRRGAPAQRAGHRVRGAEAAESERGAGEGRRCVQDESGERGGEGCAAEECVAGTVFVGAVGRQLRDGGGDGDGNDGHETKRNAT